LAFGDITLISLMRYKILILDPRKGDTLDGWTRARHEVWRRLEDALNELAADGWALRSPPVRSSTDDSEHEHLVILEHPTCDRDEDFRQQAARQQRRVTQAKARLDAGSASPMDAVTLRQDVEEQERRLKAIESERDGGAP
jgi:hypothetical protein